jgi:hypothetical protein
MEHLEQEKVAMDGSIEFMSFEELLKMLLDGLHTLSYVSGW